MRRLYSLLLGLLLPLGLFHLLWLSRRAPAYRQRLSERLAIGSSGPEPADVWIHAVSVGEVQAAQLLIRSLLLESRRVLVTTNTPTGEKRLRELVGERVRHRYMPLDLMSFMGRFLDRVQPRLVLVMETEVWPNMLAACKQREIPVMLINARLSARSAKAYARVKGFASQTFNGFSAIAVQTEEDGDRITSLGVDSARIHVTGSLKFDTEPPGSLQVRAEVLRREFGVDRPVWIAASTRDGEEELVLAAHARVRTRHPTALLVLVPRHPERFDRVDSLVNRQGFASARRSRREQAQPETAVYLGDTMGELGLMLGAADLAFIGGSLVKIGGHNPLEAAALGLPVILGPHTFNFAQISELLLARGAAGRVQDAEELAAIVSRWLADANERTQIGERGRETIAQNRGAMARVKALIDTQLSEDKVLGRGQVL